jgi:hypothetical protein
MNYTKRLTHTLKLLLATVFAVCASLSANADTFRDEASGLYFETSDDGTCSVVKPTDGTKYSGESYVIPSTVTYNDTEYSVTSIGNSAFSNCSSLTSISIPEGVTSIGESAFYYCTSLTSITIPESVTSIGSFAFRNCTSLTSVNIPESVTSIGGYAFSCCTALTSITLPESLTSIGLYTFEGCSVLTSIIIPKGITFIPSYAFSGCTSLTSVKMLGSVSSMGIGVFNDCTKLTKVDIADIKAWCKISYSSANYNPLYYAKHLYINGTEVTNLVIPSSVTAIKNYTFYNCQYLTSVTMLGSVTSIGSSAFANCTGLTSITLPESVKYIGAYAFYGCALTSIIIPEGVTSIQNNTFYDCTSLTSVTMLGSVTSIGTNAFYNCTSLNKVDIADLEAWCKIDFSRNYDNPLYYAKHLYINGTELTDLVIPETITDIKKYTFYNCKSLVTVTIPENVTSSGEYAFSVCTNLTRVNTPDIEAWCKISFSNSTSNPLYYAKHLYINDAEATDIVIPGTITNINNYTFYNCESLKSVIFSEGVTSIPTNAFTNCTSLETIYVPKSLTTFASKAFATCTSLNKVDIADLEAWCKIDFADRYSNPTYYAQHLYINGSLLTNLVIPESLTAIKNYTFEGCDDLVYIDFGSNVTSIGYESFFHCDNLKGEYTNKFTPSEYKYVLEIPSSVITIADRAFDYCPSIENLWIGTGCTSIGYQAFHCNGNLKSVTCLAYPAPALARQDVFNDVDYKNAYLYIYEGDEDTEYSDIYNSYADKDNNYWYLFLKGISVGVDEVADEDGVTITTNGMAINVAGNEGDIEVYNITGMKVYQGNDSHIDLPNSGIYVVIVNGESYKIAIK